MVYAKERFQRKPSTSRQLMIRRIKAFKDFTLRQQCRFNRFSQSASWCWRLTCVLVLLRVYICASTNYSFCEIFMVKGTARAVSRFFRTKGGARAPAVAPRLPSWHRSREETQIHGESAAFPLGPNREHMSHALFSHRLLDRTVRSAANLLSYFIIPGSVTHGNATLVKVDLRPCQDHTSMILWPFQNALHKRLFKLGPKKFSLFFFLHEGTPARWY